MAVPAAVFLAGVSVGLEQPSWRMFAVMCVISGGVLVASVGEVKFHTLGVIYQVGPKGERDKIMFPSRVSYQVCLQGVVDV